MRVTVAVGTEKGAFFVTSEDERASWDLQGPVLKGWKVTAFGRDPAGRYLLATASNWFGAALHRSDDLQAWDQIVNGPAYPEGDARRLTQIWTVTGTNGVLFAGVADAGLFRSDDGGETWQPVEGLNEHPTRGVWQPGLGGLAAHRVLVDPTNADRMWCAISAVGVFRSDDGGATWASKNQGVDITTPDEHLADVGYCVHCIVADPDEPDRIWRQDHRGVYRTTNGGDSWQHIEQGLPASFGFPVVLDPATRNVFVVPLESDEHRLPPGGRLRVYRSTDGGDTWAPSGTGMPEDPVYATVLRGAMDTDGLQPGGIYLGTTGGAVHYSRDGGDGWETMPFVLPRIQAVTAWTAE